VNKCGTLRTLVDRVAPTDLPVLITGETGVGKEVVAGMVHARSRRHSHAFVDVNCAALPDHLVESELFGYGKGAFSGPIVQRRSARAGGWGGTLFLDEIGDLPEKMQAKLLRVLDGSPYYRLGGTRKITVDVRIVAATNRDLTEAIRKGGFRLDLYHRISELEIRVPPLRERPQDVVALAEHFLSQYDNQPRLSERAMGEMLRYYWPGNIRELRNVISKGGSPGAERRDRTRRIAAWPRGTATNGGLIAGVAS
jgi:transcriptional regulator with GAF, ATPase, and Fis domain